MLSILGAAVVAAAVQNAAPQAEKLPLEYLPLMQACVTSGGQTGFTGPSPVGGTASRDLYGSHLALASASARKITLNVWAASTGVIPVTLQFVDSAGKSQNRSISANSSYTTVAKMAWLHVQNGPWTTVWCSKIE